MMVRKIANAFAAKDGGLTGHKTSTAGLHQTADLFIQYVTSFTHGSKSRGNNHGINTETYGDVVQLLFRTAFLAGVMFSLGGWMWLLGVGIKWLIVKL